MRRRPVPDASFRTGRNEREKAAIRWDHRRGARAHCGRNDFCNAAEMKADSSAGIRGAHRLHGPAE
ncbi:hypothetical protein EMIT0111MI5_10039 [Burkholderia sp. IT-111MI5]